MMKLSEQQQKAIEATGQVLLLAVPGSGKTTTLVARLRHMVMKQGIDPSSILVITYTNAAANDMKARFLELTRAEADAVPIRFCTINSFCYSVLTFYARRYHRSKPEDLTETLPLIRQLLQRISHIPFPSESEVGDMARQITYAKNRMLNEEEIGALLSGETKVQPVFDAYTRWMKEHHYMDYDDQILFAWQLLRKVPGLLRYFREKYRYILVDEAQDTSKLQHEVIRLLTGPEGNLFMVGDEDQSIYGFRAAWPEALLSFREYYPRGRVLYLERNYRSSRAIVGVSARIIGQNQKRYPKAMRAVRSDSGTARILRFRSRLGQYRQITEMLRGGGPKTAVLYRNNDSAVPVVFALEEAGIPYSVRGLDTMFFHDKIVQDALAILRFAMDPRDFDALDRIYYKFGARIPKQALLEAEREVAGGRSGSVLEELSGSKRMARSQKEKIIDLETEFRIIRSGDSSMDAFRRISETMNYQYGKSEKIFLLRALTEKGESLAAFLEKIEELEQRILHHRNEADSRVVLSTIHSAKGLEYERVILIDAVEDILPAKDGDPEEERRIFYVGVTRARDELDLAAYDDFRQPFLEELRTDHSADFPRRSGAGIPDVPSAKG